MTLQRVLRFALPFLLAFITFMALSPAPPITPISGMGDKVQHMAAFATLALVCRLAYPRAAGWRIFERLVLFGAGIEVFQAIPDLHRTCDWHDWAADVFAAGMMLILCEAGRLWWLRRT